MNRYNIEITFENGHTKMLKNMTQVLIKQTDQYQFRAIDDFLSSENKLKPYGFIGDTQRFDFVKLKDAIYIHYYKE